MCECSTFLRKYVLFLIKYSKILYLCLCKIGLNRMKGKHIKQVMLSGISYLIAVCFFASCVNVVNEGYEIPVIEIPEEPEVVVGYKGDDLTGVVEIIRDRTTKEVKFTITESCEWQLYAGPTLDLISMREPVAEGDAAGTFIIDVPFGSQCYFQVVTPGGNAILSERRSAVSGATNFRDMGGYKTTDGRYVKWGTLYRSNALSSLTTADLAYVSSIPLVSVVDFRGPTEGTGDILPATTTYYRYPIVLGAWPGYGPFYESLVVAPEYIAQLKSMFTLLKNKDNTPLLIHCTAGRDRTGVGAALILLALGVDKETVIADYLLTNVYVPEYGDIYRSYLESTLNKINSTYGSIDQFFKDQMGIENIETFRDMYLLGEKR